ncbi:head decoration protein [Rhizobium sp. CNPSo 4039]|uniref:head decoration protein n=1 Tax=Rhizobium sp. CNPSo 4039 TaxID=3021409 RepID=UPI0025514AB1|nr:head decoration protein [Rhizobium sp. CNPSo 4039]MDK4714678.1 head decoration protein [Rhizobium sp. CNPSo 4039]
MQTFSYKTESDIVKDEGKNRFSRDTDTLASGSGKVVTGTVLGKLTNGGKFKPLAPDATDGTQIAAAIILQRADATAGDQEVVNLKRRAQVVLQNLVWPGAITAAQKQTALDQLAALGIIARMGV